MIKSTHTPLYPQTPTTLPPPPTSNTPTPVSQNRDIHTNKPPAKSPIKTQTLIINENKNMEIKYHLQAAFTCEAQQWVDYVTFPSPSFYITKITTIFFCSTKTHEAQTGPQSLFISLHLPLFWISFPSKHPTRERHNQCFFWLLSFEIGSGTSINRNSVSDSPNQSLYYYNFISRYLILIIWSGRSSHDDRADDTINQSNLSQTKIQLIAISHFTIDCKMTVISRVT